MNHWIRRIAVAGLMLGAATGIIACSDDDGDAMTMEAYFAAVDTIDNEASEEIDAAFAAITDDSDVSQLSDAFVGVPTALEQAAADLEDLNPPEEAQAAHDALVDALNDFADETQALADDAADAENPEDFFAIVESDEFTAADEKFTASCLDLQQVAADNGITVDLGCEDEEDDASAAAEQAVRDIAAAWNDSDIDTFGAMFTDAGLVAVFGEGESLPREEILAGIAEQIGDGPIEIDEITSESTETGAEVTVLWVSGKVMENFRFALIDEAGAWKIDGQEQLPVEAPAGSTLVNIDLNEFAFGFDAAQMTSTGTLVLVGNNVGSQEHHLLFAKIPDDANLEELLMSEEDVPGFEFIGGSEPAAPGSETSSIVLAAPLEPGRYTFVCFLPDTADPEGAPHAFKGMTADFVVE